MKVHKVDSVYKCPWCKKVYEGAPEHDTVINFPAYNQLITVEEAQAKGFFYERFKCEKGHCAYSTFGATYSESMPTRSPGYKCGICGKLYLTFKRAVGCCKEEVAFQRMIQAKVEEAEAKEREMTPA